MTSANSQEDICGTDDFQISCVTCCIITILFSGLSIVSAVVSAEVRETCADMVKPLPSAQMYGWILCMALMTMTVLLTTHVQCDKGACIFFHIAVATFVLVYVVWCVIAVASFVRHGFGIKDDCGADPFYFVLGMMVAYSICITIAIVFQRLTPHPPTPS